MTNTVLTVAEFIDYLTRSYNMSCAMCPLATRDSNGNLFTCARCPMHKAEGKACPVQQMGDILDALRYAVDHSVQGISKEMPIDNPMVILYIKRVVIEGSSVYTLRPCNDDYIKLRNLLPIDLGGD